MNATLCACPKLCRGVAARAWWTLRPRFRGSRARVADRRRAISVAVKPMDVVALSDVLSYTLCVIHAHTLYALPFRYVSDAPSSPSLPLSARPVTVRCGLLWGIYAPAFALNVQWAGSIPSDTTPLMANRPVYPLRATVLSALIGLYYKYFKVLSLRGL